MEAVGLLRQLPDLERSPELLVVLGGAYLEAEQYSAALLAFDTASDLDKESVEALSGKAAAYEGMEHWGTAATFLRQAIKLAASSARYTILGHLETAAKELGSAQESFETALQMDPGNEEALFNLAVLIREEDPGKAEELLAEAIRIDPEFSAASREFGFMLLGRGLTAEAEGLLSLAASLDADDAWTRVYLGNLKFGTGDYATAIGHLRKAAELEPLWGLPRRMIGDVLLKAPALGDAATEFREAFTLDATDHLAAVRLGVSLVNRGDLDEGRYWIQMAREIDPSVIVPAEIMRILDNPK